MFTRSVVACLTACVLAPAAGCFTTSHRAGPRDGPPPTLPAEAWTVRDTTAMRTIMEATPREIRSVAAVAGSTVQLPAPDYIVEHQKLNGGGLLRVWTEPGRDLEPHDPILELLGGFVPDGAFLTARALRDPTNAEDLAEAREDATRRNGREKQAGLTHIAVREEVLLREGIAIQMPARADRARKGLVVYLTSLIPNKYEASVVHELRDRGWAVMGLESETKLAAPQDAAELARVEGLRQEQRELRARMEGILDSGPMRSPLGDKEYRELLTRDTAIEMDVIRIRKGRLECCDEASARDAGKTLAGLVDELIEDQACAAEAALAYLAEERPDVPREPVVIVAFSAGTLAAPAVAARLGSAGRAPEAVVLVGGGADVATIMRETELERSSVPVACAGGPVSDRVWGWLHASYLEHTRLDPVKTAPLLAGTRVLQVHAKTDTIIPAKTGRALHAALGRPDRIDYTFGHLWMFYHLPDVRERIADWVESNTAPR